MILLAEIIFWCSLTAVVSTYFLYPLALILLAPFRKRHTIGSETPSVTLVISAFNEEAVIGEKLENSLSLDYPADRLEILVVSDQSNDATDEIVSAYSDRRVTLCRQEQRRGKSYGLTQFVPQARGEIVVFSDANSIYDRDALRKLVRHFADPVVGFVVGYQRYVEQDSAASISESLYWRYETALKVQESRLGSVVCGDGAIYAIRAELFEPLREDDINDFLIPLKIVTRGYRGIFDQEAICYETTAADFLGEFRRKIRIVNRSLQAVLRAPQALNPFRVGWFALQLLIHKVLRWFVPFFLVTLLAASVYLAAQGSWFYLVFLLLQLAFYALALLKLVPIFGNLKPVYIANYFCIINAAAGLGVLWLLFGKRIVTWTPERAPADGAAATAKQ